MNKGLSGRKTDRLKCIVPMCIAFAALVGPTATLARDVTIGGGISVGYEFDDRQYDDDAPTAEEQQNARDNNNDERHSRIRTTPTVNLTSTAARDIFALRYSPSYRYDFENSDNNVDHNLVASLSRDLTQRWKMKLADSYLLTDRVYNRDDTAASDSTAEQPTQTDDTTDTDSTVRLSDNENRREYWTNNASLRSAYTYWEGSVFTLGYSYRVLRNIDTDVNSSYEDYDRHEVLSELAHRFNSVWKLSVNGSYIRGLYDQAESDQTATDENASNIDNDLHEYLAGSVIEAALFEHQLQSLAYRFHGVDFDAPDQNSATIHAMTLGWQWGLSKDLMFKLGAGPSYAKTEGSDGNWGYNGNLACSYGFERGGITLTANRGFERNNFTGTNENGLREFWQSRLNVHYQVWQNVTANLYTSYRDEDEEVVTVITPEATDQATTTDGTDFATETETFNRNRFSTGASLGYTFQQWYKIALSYDYIQQDSEKVDDSFDEHRVSMVLSYQTVFFKW